MTQSYIEHFGIKTIQRKYALKINRDEFALINTKPSLPRFESLVKRGAYEENSDKLKYREEWCKFSMTFWRNTINLKKWKICGIMIMSRDIISWCWTSTNKYI